MTGLILPPLGAGNLLSIVIVCRNTLRFGFRLANRASRYRFLKPIHNVKDRSDDRHHASPAWIRFPISLDIAEGGGAYRDRTDDLKLAKLALSQLS